MIDLHSHSSASDGVLTPEEAAGHAVQKKLLAWALTDHDTVDGLSGAARACAKSGSPVIFVPGIEVSIRWPSGEFHLLGLGLRSYSDELRSLTDNLSENRRNRNLEIVENMNRDGIDVTLEEIESLFPTKQLGRPHFASYLVQIKKVRCVQEAFNRYLGKGRPYYVKNEGEDLDVAVEAIKSAGGVPVIAHPLSLHISRGKMTETIGRIRSHGVEGMEAWHPSSRVGECFNLERLAKSLGMFVTAGSDFHGKSVRADRHLGRTSGDRKISDRFWHEELAPRLGDFDYKKTVWS